MTLRLGSALMILAAAAQTAPATAQGRATFCCTDDRGTQVCSDVLPRQCYGRAYREINPQGVTVRRIDAPLTADQRAAKETEERKAKEEQVRRLEQDRKDRALLATYTSENDVDAARDRAVADIQKAIAAAQDKLAELEKQGQKLDGEAEFYKKKTMPAALQAQIDTNASEKLAQRTAIATKQKDIETAKARYENDKRRYRELTGKTPAGGTAAAAAKPSAADSRPR